MNKIIVTGASGFIGRHTLQPLVEKGFTVVGLYYRNEALCEMFPQVIWEQTNLFDERSRLSVLQKHAATHLLHLAWDVPPSEFWHSLKNIEWLTVSLQLFKEFCESGGCYFAGAGSLAEYNWDNEELNEMNTPLEPKTLYGQCKKSCFDIIRQIRNYHYPAVKLAWARIGYFFGEGEPNNKLISTLIRKIKAAEEISVIESCSRDYAHVSYLAEALACAMMRNEDFVFNASGGYQSQIAEIAKFIGKYLKSPVKTNANHQYVSAINEPKILKPNLDRMVSLLGKKPNNTFFEDLGKMIDAKV